MPQIQTPQTLDTRSDPRMCFGLIAYVQIELLL